MNKQKKIDAKSIKEMQSSVAAACKEFLTNHIDKMLEKYKPERNDGNYNDDTFSQLLSDCICDYFKFNTTTNCWWFYDHFDGTWKKDECDCEIIEAVKQFVECVKVYAGRLPKKGINTNLLKEINNYSNLTCQKRLLVSARNVEQRKFSCNDLDKQATYLNCQNGVLDIETGELIKHSPWLMLSKVTTCDYEPTAETSQKDLWNKWTSFISEITSDPDEYGVFHENPEKAEFLQIMFGYCLTDDTSKDKTFFLHGETTRNGKSTLVNSIANALGNYATSMSPDSIALRYNKNASAPSPDIAAIKGTRLVTMAEPKNGLRIDSGLFKSLTGGDKIKARFLHEHEIEFSTTCKLVLHANYLPIITDEAVFNSKRIFVIPFRKHFDEETQNTDLENEFSTPEMKSVILRWAYLGNLKLKANNEKFKAPECVTRATEEYAASSNKLKLFVKDTLIESKDESDFVTLSNLYEVYKQWSSAQDFELEGKQNFQVLFLKLYRNRFRAAKKFGNTTYKNVFLGLKIRDEFTV